MKPILWTITSFETLSANQLYQIMALRNEVFIVEQNCVYQDLDYKDQKAMHVFGKIDTNLVAYCRVFKAGNYFANASIGRVITNPKYRNLKIGDQLINQAINTIKQCFNEDKITISAQEHLQHFYEKHGFIKTSDSYLEDNIPHIEMQII